MKTHLTWLLMLVAAPAVAKVDRVVVYPDRATVVRVAPVPCGARATVAWSSRAAAFMSSGGVRTSRMESATLAPTPWMCCRRTNQARSSSVRNPKSLMWSSRTWVSMKRETASPGAGSRASVRPQQATR